MRLSIEHRQHKGLNNQAENSHNPTRQKGRQMKRFKPPGKGAASSFRAWPDKQSVPPSTPSFESNRLSCGPQAGIFYVAGSDRSRGRGATSPSTKPFFTPKPGIDASNILTMPMRTRNFAKSRGIISTMQQYFIVLSTLVFAVVVSTMHSCAFATTYYVAVTGSTFQLRHADVALSHPAKGSKYSKTWRHGYCGRWHLHDAHFPIH